jgi:hypothetical protein
MSIGRSGMMTLFLSVLIASCTAPDIPVQIRKSSAQDPAVRIIANAFFASGSHFIMVNENHGIDWHRHVSACILDEIAKAGPTILGVEAYQRHGVIAARDVEPRGYAEEPYFQHIWSVAQYYGLPVFGYDAIYKTEANVPKTKKMFSVDEMVQRGLRPWAIDRREAKAAENILKFIVPYPEHTIYLHVGFQHVSEVWKEYDEGGEGWLAAQITHLTGENPLTVYQIGPERFANYERKKRLITDLNQCATQSQMIPVLRTGQGQIGCLQRTSIGEGMGSDFIIADPVGESDRVDIVKAALCDVH